MGGGRSQVVGVHEGLTVYTWMIGIYRKRYKMTLLEKNRKGGSRLHND